MKHRSTIVLAALAALGALSLQAQAVTGSGTASTIPLWTGTSTLGNSKLFQNANGMVGLGTTTPTYTLDVNGGITANNMNASSSYAIAGQTVLAQPGGRTGFNTAVGPAALGVVTTGNFNLAVGISALLVNTTGSNNVAVGPTALAFNTTGQQNVVVGGAAGNKNTTGFGNTALGNDALFSNTTGSSNTAIGASALQHAGNGPVTTGSNNIAIGYQAGAQLANADGNNIDIANLGTAGDNHTIRIGSSNQTSFFAAGISGTNVTGVPVLISSSGQLGVQNSSIRFKKDVQDMAGASAGLLRLRPVTYRYKEPYADGSQPVDYGLVAEEVAQVYPDLVVRSEDGQIQTVQYQKLTPMLLNEVQKEHQLIERQAETIRQLEKRLEALETAAR